MKLRSAGVAYLTGGLSQPNYFWESPAVTTRHPPLKGGISGESDLDTELKFGVSYDQSENDITLGTSLQYGGCKGPEEIIQFICDHTDLVHEVPYNYGNNHCRKYSWMGRIVEDFCVTKITAFWWNNMCFHLPWKQLFP
jgi:hypothetical protein